MSNDPDSPCVARCSTALGDNVCRGCARTFTEVSGWCAFTPDAKQAIRAALPVRQRLMALAHAAGLAFDLVECEGETWGQVQAFDAEPVRYRYENDALVVLRAGRRHRLPVSSGAEVLTESS